jgi:hypothetical protein
MFTEAGNLFLRGEQMKPPLTVRTGQFSARAIFWVLLILALSANCSSAFAIAPKDAPVSAGGEGATGNDWVDFNAQPVGILFWTDAAGPHIATTLSLTIDTLNPNYVLANNRTAGGAKVIHQCYRDDYGRPAGPTVAQGNVDWDNYYAGYNPAIGRDGDCTVVTNCVSFAFSGYKNGAVCQNWVNSGADANPFVAELNAAGAPTQAGDRCYNDAHVWQIINEEGNCGKGHCWKNNSSGIYHWFPNPYVDTGASGNGGGNVCVNFIIVRT